MRDERAVRVVVERRSTTSIPHLRDMPGACETVLSWRLVVREHSPAQLIYGIAPTRIGTVVLNFSVRTVHKPHR